MASERVQITLADLGPIITGKTPSTKVPEHFGGMMLFVTPSDMDGRKVIDSTERTLTDKGADTVKNAIVPARTVMVSCIGSDMGKVAIAGQSCVTNQQINSIVVSDDHCADYVYYNLSLRKAELKSLAAGSAQPILNKGHFAKVPIEMPNRVEQQRIANILGKLDDKIELNRRMNRTLEKMAAAIFKSWFIDFDLVHAKAEGRDLNLPAEIADLFPNSFEESELGAIPNGWVPGTLGDVIEILDSKRIPLSSAERAMRKGPYPYYGAAGILDHVDDFLFSGTHVLMGEDGSVVTSDDKPVVQYVWNLFWVNNHAHVLRGKNGFTEEHLYLFLKQLNIRPYVTGAVQPKLNQRNMKSIPLVVPPMAVSEAFGQIVRPLFQKFRANADQGSTLASLRDTLLPKLLSGEIEVPEAEPVGEELV